MFTKTKFELFSILATNGTAYIHVNGVKYILIGIDREDGSGSCFILHLRDLNDSPTIYQKFVRTID